MTVKTKIVSNLARKTATLEELKIVRASELTEKTKELLIKDLLILKQQRNLDIQESIIDSLHTEL